MAVTGHGNDLLGRTGQIALGHQQLFDIAAVLMASRMGLRPDSRFSGGRKASSLGGSGRNSFFGAGRCSGLGAGRSNRSCLGPGFRRRGLFLKALGIPLFFGRALITVFFVGLARTAVFLIPVLGVFPALLLRFRGGTAIAGALFFPFAFGPQVILAVIFFLLKS
jgi:hypothetical protein